MRQCVAKIEVKDETGNWTKISCGNDTEPGFRYCEEHKTRKWAVKEREEKSLNTVVDATDFFPSENISSDESNDKVGKELAREAEATNKEAKLPLDQQSIFEKTTTALNKMIAHEEWTGELVATLGMEELRYQDKAGAEQLHSYMALHERAMDRVLRAVTAVAKLDIDAQSVNANKMLRQMVKVCVTNTLTRMGMAPHEIEQARQILAEEFEKAAGAAS